MKNFFKKIFSKQTTQPTKESRVPAPKKYVPVIHKEKKSKSAYTGPKKASSARLTLYDVIKKPHVTEKSAALSKKSIYVFEVDKRANKHLVKEAVTVLYGVTPRRVTMSRIAHKPKRTLHGKGQRGAGKKAYVFLKDGDTITFT